MEPCWLLLIQCIGRTVGDLEGFAYVCCWYFSDWPMATEQCKLICKDCIMSKFRCWLYSTPVLPEVGLNVCYCLPKKPFQTLWQFHWPTLVENVGLLNAAVLWEHSEVCQPQRRTKVRKRMLYIEIQAMRCSACRTPQSLLITCCFVLKGRTLRLQRAGQGVAAPTGAPASTGGWRTAKYPGQGHTLWVTFLTSLPPHPSAALDASLDAPLSTTTARMDMLCDGVWFSRWTVYIHVYITHLIHY